MTPQTTRPASAFALDVPDALLARLRRGDAVAFEQVYRWFERPVFTLALRVCGDREQAADVLQDTMLKAFDRAGDFRGGGDAGGDAPFWAWLRRIAVNQALMALRGVQHGFDPAWAGDILTWTLTYLDAQVRGLPDAQDRLARMTSVEGGGDDRLMVPVTASVP